MDTRAEYRHWVGDRLPQLAREHGWQIRFDHCFGRIVLDNCVRGDWRQHIPSPAWKHLDEAQLARAIGIAERIAGDPTGGVLYALDRNSHIWRCKKLKAHHLATARLALHG